MEIEQLKIVVAVARAGTVTGAAREINLTQPAVSRKIQQLEDQLGVDIFERGPGGMSPTAAGRVLLERARTMIDDMQDLERRAQRADERNYFDIRVGTLDSVATWIIPSVVHCVDSAFPDLTWRFRTEQVSVLSDQLRRGVLDVVIAPYSGTPPFDRTDSVGRFPHQFYGSAELFADLRQVTKREQLEQFPVVYLDADAGTSPPGSEGIHSSAVVGSYAAVKSLVLGGFGIGALHHFMLDDGEHEQLVRADVTFNRERRLYLVCGAHWRGDAEDSIASELLSGLERNYPQVE